MKDNIANKKEILGTTSQEIKNILIIKLCIERCWILSVIECITLCLAIFS